MRKRWTICLLDKDGHLRYMSVDDWLCELDEWGARLAAIRRLGHQPRLVVSVAYELDPVGSHDYAAMEFEGQAVPVMA